MDARSLNGVLKFLFAALFVACIVKASHTFFLSDASYFHAAKGREIAMAADLPKTDPFTYAKPGNWNASSWLFDLFYYATIAGAGIGVSFAIKTIFLLMIFSGLFLVVYKRLQGKYLTAVFLFLLPASWIIAAGAAVSPELVSVLFITYFFYVLERKPSKRNSLLYFSLPVAALVWSNMSPLSLVALPVMAVYVIYRSIDRSEIPEKTESYDFRLLVMSFAALIPALVLNPGFINGAKNFVLSFGSGWLNGFDTVTVSGRVFAAVCVFHAALLVILLFINVKGADVGRHADLVKDTLITALFLGIGLKDVSYAPVAAAATLPITAYYVFLIFRWGFVWPRQWTERDWQAIKKSFYLMLIPALALYVFAPPLSAPEKLLPSQAVSYISNVKVPGPVFAQEEKSPYMLFYLYPTYKMMITPFSGKEAREDYKAIKGGGEKFRETAERYSIASYLIENGSPIAGVVDKERFAPAYFDDNYIIFVEKEKSDRYFTAIDPAAEENFYAKENRQKAAAELRQFADAYPSQKAHLMYASLLAGTDRNAAIDYLQYTVESFRENSKLYALLGKLLYEAGDFENAAEALSKTSEKSGETDRMFKDARRKARHGG